MIQTPDPKKLLEALQAVGDAGLPFPSEAVARARAFAKGEAEPSATEVEALPEPLALAVLEATVRARRPALAEGLAESAKKPLAKAAKKALYQLRSMGVAVEEKKPAPAPAPAPAAPAPAEDLPCLLTPIDGTGERALIVVRPHRGGGLDVHQIVFNDEVGLVEIGSGDLNRSAYRKQLKELRAAPVKTSIEITLDEARALLAEAAGVNLRARAPLPGDAEDVLRSLDITAQEAPPTVPPPEEGDARLAVDAGKLHEERELTTWLPPRDELQRLALKMQEVMTSPLQLSEVQRSEQLLQAFRSAAEAFFTPAMKRVYGVRLWKMADYFARTGRAQAAELARAEARRLFHDTPGLFTRFGEQLFEKVLRLTQRPRPDLPPEPGEPRLPQAPAGPPEKKSPGGLILP